MSSTALRPMLYRPILLTALLITPAGCVPTEALPRTYPVNGKVVQKDGSPYPGGSIIFMSVADPEMRGYGQIHSDGTFTLDSIAMFKNATSQRVPGTIEGEFRVNITPPVGGVAAAAKANANKSTDDSAKPDAAPSFGGPPSLGGSGRPFTLRKIYKVQAVENNEIKVVIE